MDKRIKELILDSVKPTNFYLITSEISMKKWWKMRVLVRL